MSIDGIYDRPHGSVYSNRALDFNKQNAKQQDKHLSDTLENVGSQRLAIQNKSTVITF